MKFYMHRPPDMKGTKEGSMEALTSWLYVLCERLNVVLSNLSEENFTPAVKEKLFTHKEDKK